MAARDIWPLIHHEGGHERTVGLEPTAASTFLEGEGVTLVNAGTVSVIGDDPAASQFYGIAATRATMPWSQGTTRLRETVTVYLPSGQYRSSNFATDGAGTTAVPTVANAIGETFGITVSGGSHIVDTGTANVLGIIEDVLDAQGMPLGNALSVGAGVVVVVRFTDTQVGA